MCEIKTTKTYDSINRKWLVKIKTGDDTRYEEVNATIECGNHYFLSNILKTHIFRLKIYHLKVLKLRFFIKF